MSDSESKKELTGLARSLDELFRHHASTPSPATPPGGSEAGRVVVETPPAAEGTEIVEGPPSLPAPESEPAALPAAEPAPPPLPGTEAAPPPLPTGAASPPPLPEAPVEPPPLPESTVEPLPDPDPVPPPLPESASVPPPLPEEGVTRSPAGSPPEPVAETPPGTAPDAVAFVDDEESFEPTSLDRAVDAYLAGEETRAAEIERLADELLDAREVDPVVRSLARLVLAAGEPPEEGTLSAARPLVGPVVLSRLARLMGSARSEERRRDYFRVCRVLGPEMAAAIRDDLAETTDRHARRVHCEALVAMGPAGRPTIEAMAADENRFLVRNAIAILGEVGGEGAVELIRPELANPDARVRKEALRSLARLGDRDSAELVLARLEDGDEEVALAAAVAAGELGIERAVKPVVAMLDATKDPDRAIALIRVLGQLGDPGAVPSIEKHAVPSLFSKPPTEVRIQAYRALERIGTPRARKLLNRAMEDRDGAVRAAVRDVLGMA